jgi:hypothetical protein
MVSELVRIICKLSVSVAVFTNELHLDVYDQICISARLVDNHTHALAMRLLAVKNV